MKPPLSLVPALPAAVGVVAAIWLSSQGLAMPALVCGIVGFIALYAAKWHYASAYFAMCAIGAASCLIHQNGKPTEAMLHDRAAYCAQVVSVKQIADGQQIVVRLDATKTAGDSAIVSLSHPIRCLLRQYGSEEELLPGDKVAFVASLSPLPALSGVPYETDYNSTLRREGIEYTATVYGSRIKTVEYAGGLRKTVNDLRATLEGAIVTAPISGSTAAFLLASILGDGEYLLYDSRQAYRATGTAHILALSGLHVGIIAYLLSLAFFPLRTFRHARQIESYTSIIIIWVYAVVVGMGPSVQRAAVMATVYLLARALQGRTVPLNTLLLALAVVLVTDPSSISSPALHLSFAAVAAIMLFIAVMPAELGRHRLARFAVDYVGLPIAAMMGTSLVSAFYFGFFPTLFLVGNLIVALFFPTLLSLGVVMLVLNLCGIAPGWLGWVLDRLCQGMDGGIRYVYDLHIPNIEGIQFNAWAMLPYAAALVFGALAIHYRATWWHRHSLSKGLALCCAASLMAIVPMQLFTKRPLPGSALYIPQTTPQGVIMTQNGKPQLIPLCKEERTERLIRDYNRRFHRYLAVQGCDTFGILACSSKMIRIGGRSIAVVGDSATALAKADCALVSGRFTGTAEEILSAAKPDTLVLSASVAPARAARLKREWGDTATVIDLRRRPFSIAL